MKKSLANVLSLVGLLMALCALGSTNAWAAENTEASGVVNVNTASEAQLQMLPGIGPAKARAILEYRSKNQFSRPEDLVKVKGIGNKLLAKIRPFVVTEGQTTLKASVKKGRARPK